MQLLDSTSYDSGVTLLRYEPASCASLAEGARQPQYETMSGLYAANRASKRRARSLSLCLVRTNRFVSSTPGSV